MRKCVQCKEKIVELCAEDKVELITYQQWKNRSEKRVVKCRESSAKLMEKMVVESSIGELIDHFTQFLPAYLQHTFTIDHQHVSMKHKRNKLEENEIVIHCDFSENYVLKYAEEIKSMHFGASKRQSSIPSYRSSVSQG